SDLVGIIPSITGKIELVYEGEQEGPYQVAMNLLDKSIRTQFIQYFPNPDTLKKRAPRKGETPQAVDNPYRSIISWFDKGNHLNLFFDTNDREKMNQLYAIDGLHALVKKTFSHASEKEAALLMEFVLHGLSSFSLISKKIMETSIEFKDLMGSMLNIQSSTGFDDLEDDDFN
ncbi:MAG TPA: magnesium chelatase, partial [Flavisolibacter sp.]|nr:magnesium chelatase [Flavisolibacter sp.]